MAVSVARHLTGVVMSATQVAAARHVHRPGQPRRGVVRRPAAVVSAHRQPRFEPAEEIATEPLAVVDERSTLSASVPEENAKCRDDRTVTRVAGSVAAP